MSCIWTPAAVSGAFTAPGTWPAATAAATLGRGAWGASEPDAATVALLAPRDPAAVEPVLDPEPFGWGSSPPATGAALCTEAVAARETSSAWMADGCRVAAPSSAGTDGAGPAAGARDP